MQPWLHGHARQAGCWKLVLHVQRSAAKLRRGRLRNGQQGSRVCDTVTPQHGVLNREGSRCKVAPLAAMQFGMEQAALRIGILWGQLQQSLVQRHGFIVALQLVQRATQVAQRLGIRWPQCKCLLEAGNGLA